MNVKTNIWVGILLIIINVLLFNLILDRTTGLRADLTEGSIYSLSPVTERILGDLDEEVSVKAFISEPENLPEELRPHVPELLSLLSEYEERSDNKVVVERIVPESDSKIEDEAQNTYGVQPQTFAFREQNQSGVKSFYCAITVSYAGSRPETIDASDLVDRGSIFEPGRNIKLKNVEFAMTRAIKRAVYGFEGQRNIFDRVKEPIEVTTFVSPTADLPELFRETPERLDKVLTELAEESGGKLIYKKVEISLEDPAEGDDEAARALEEKMVEARNRGAEPLGFPGSDRPFFLWASCAVGEKLYRPSPMLGLEGALSEFDIRDEFEGFIKQITPGSLRTIAIVQKTPPPPNPMMGRQRPQPARFSSIAENFRGEYEVRSLDPGTLSRVPREVDVLVVPSDGEYSERALFAIDQFVMQGGKAIFAVDGSDVTLQQGFTITASKRKSGLEDLLKTWGVTVSEDLVFDAGTRAQFFWARRKGGRGGRPSIVNFKWSALPTVGYSPETANRELNFMGGFEAGGFWFPHALETEAVEGLESRWVFRTTEKSFRHDPESPGGVDPNPDLHPESGYAVPGDDKLKTRDLGVLLTGTFPSHFANRAIPAAESNSEKAEGEAAPESEEGEKNDDATGAPLKSSAKTRVLVIGNDDWIDDFQAQIYQAYPDFGYFAYNANFLKDTVAWMLEDDDLVQVRNRGRSFRPLEELDEDEKSGLQLLNFALPLALLALVGVGVTVTRFNRRPTL